MFFAFNEEQFKKGIKKLNLKENEKIISIGAGGYIAETKIQDFYKMFERQKQEIDNAIKNDLTGNGFIKEMFREELNNHEYYITSDLEVILDALNLAIEDINNNENLKNGLELARTEYLQACSRMDDTEDEEFEN